MQKYFDTEGEKIVEFFLGDEGLSYKKQVEISKLKGDYADYRVADFYIPKYKVYIEFLGKWNNEEIKSKYIKKMELYEENKIPCIYIYPDNLATLKYLFYMRLIDQFEKYPELKNQYIKYKIKTIIEKLGYIWFVFYFLSILIIITTNITKSILIITPISAIIDLIIFLITIGLSIYVIKFNIQRNTRNQ